MGDYIMIGERLRDLRDDKGINQEKMAQILGVSRGHYGMWEIEKESIPLKRLNYLCNYFNISMDFIIGRVRTYNGNGTHELDAKEIGKRIKSLRKTNNISQEELATILNTTHSVISNYELGKFLILTDFAITISKTFNISLDYLCGRIDIEK